MTELERLERASGSRYQHTRYDADVAAQKAITAPGTLTDLDLAVLAYFGSDGEAMRAREARAKAQKSTDAPSASVAPGAAPRLEFPDQLWDTEAPDLVQEMDRWSEAHAMNVLPVRIWWTFVKVARARRLELAATVAALEQRIAHLETATTEADATHGSHSAKPRLKFRGAWQPERAYDLHDAVVHHGQLYVATTWNLSADLDNHLWEKR
jgi:hypothetical protein